VLVLVLGLVLAAAPRALAEEPTPSTIKLDGDVKKDEQPGASVELAPPPEAPPPTPRHKGVVLDATLGAMGFLGTFRRVAPPGPWLHIDGGYEPLKWLLVFGEAELAFTDTSIAQDDTKARAFPIFGFGAGVRPKIHFSDRVAMFAQIQLGILKADVSQNALGLIGYRDAEDFSLHYGGRLGLEWYQIDRHLALGLMGGLRHCSGFAKFGTRGEAALLWDSGATLRYSF
jgi:hypothetical protein